MKDNDKYCITIMHNHNYDIHKIKLIKMLAYVRQMGYIKCHVWHDKNAMHKFQAQDLESEKEYNGRTVYN